MAGFEPRTVEYKMNDSPLYHGFKPKTLANFPLPSHRQQLKLIFKTLFYASCNNRNKTKVLYLGIKRKLKSEIN